MSYCYVVFLLLLAFYKRRCRVIIFLLYFSAWFFQFVFFFFSNYRWLCSFFRILSCGFIVRNIVCDVFWNEFCSIQWQHGPRYWYRRLHVRLCVYSGFDLNNESKWVSEQVKCSQNAYTQATHSLKKMVKWKIFPLIRTEHKNRWSKYTYKEIESDGSAIALK